MTGKEIRSQNAIITNERKRFNQMIKEKDDSPHEADWVNPLDAAVAVLCKNDIIFANFSTLRKKCVTKTIWKCFECFRLFSLHCDAM